MTSPVSSRLTRLAATSAGAAAVIWLTVWLQQYRAHGRTARNEERLVLGLTWMDASKLLPLAVLLLLPALEVLVRRAGQDPARNGARALEVTLGRVVQGCLVVAAAGGAVDFWPFPWGSYAQSFESRQAAGVPAIQVVPWQFAACVVAGLLLLALAVARRRAGDLEPVVLVVLASGFALGSLWTPVYLWPVVAWALVGCWVARTKERPRATALRPAARR